MTDLSKIKIPEAFIHHEWRAVGGYEKTHIVSEYGVVIRLERVYWSKSNKSYSTLKQRVIKPFVTDGGYFRIVLTINGESKKFQLARLVCSAWHANPENKPEVNHIDGKPSNNHYSNLEWVTRSENSIHAYKIGLQKIQKGEDRYCSKLKEYQVLDILNRQYNSANCKFFSKKYGVNYATIYDVYKRRTWRHVNP